MKDRYEVVVIGSGYGAAIAASRMARAGRTVCILERGRELRAGEYPDTQFEATRELQGDIRGTRIGSRTALFDFHANDDINVLVGCGLGGTSLINANVALRAEPRVFESGLWPPELVDDLPTRVEDGYRRAEEMLRPRPYPNDAPPLKKLEALEKSAKALNAPFFRPPINVTFEDGVNHVGVEQRACTYCGDCVAGCNYEAKNTLLMNYLPDARNHGAEIFTQVPVRTLERRDDRWLVHFQPLETGRDDFAAPTMFVEADVVFLGAGSLGSTEILLRSRSEGLALSGALGTRFTGNGDVLGFGYNCEDEINGMGMGERDPADHEPVGPTITGIIDMRNQPNLTDGMVIEEGVIPGALAGGLPPIFAACAAAMGRDTDKGVGDMVGEMGREMESLVRGPRHGAMRNTQTYLVMTHDDGNGRMELRDDKLRIDWIGVGSQPIFTTVDGNLEAATRALGGTMIPNPTWTELSDHDLVTVHPLGGCAMGTDAAGGVVNHKSQVFTGEGDAVYDDLYVTDGAIVPVPVGVNPLLTICALAERAVALAAEDRGWSIDYEFGSVVQPEAEPVATTIEFTERMHGFFSTEVTTDFEEGARRGERSGSPFEFVLTIVSDDLATMLEDPNHAAHISGSVLAPALSPGPLTVVEGAFNLFSSDPADPSARRMRYRMQMESEEGGTFFFEGFKVIRDDAGFDTWRDTTTLYITIHEGAGSTDPVIGSGILRIAATDFMKQMTTMHVRNPETALEGLEGLARFGRLFAGELFHTYGGVKKKRVDAPARKKRALRAPVPETHAVMTDDGVRLRLMRYRGKKGPVILLHGIASSADTFTTDTVDANLVEYLSANGYDVWVLDWRSSVDLATPGDQTLDDAARRDFPAAFAHVLDTTGADDVHVVAQDVAGMALFMALLGGLTGVRSVVASQAATHLPGIAVSPELDTTVLYERSRLNRQTEGALPELIGTPHPALLRHLVEAAKAGHLVTASGDDGYVTHLERLDLPITFVHGSENRFLRSDAMEMTVAALAEVNGDATYATHVIQGYGNSDCIFGAEAARDVYPVILAHLEATNTRTDL